MALDRAPAHRELSRLPSHVTVLRGQGRRNHLHHTDDETEAQEGQRLPAPGGQDQIKMSARSSSLWLLAQASAPP